MLAQNRMVMTADGRSFYQTDKERDALLKTGNTVEEKQRESEKERATRPPVSVGDPAIVTLAKKHMCEARSLPLPCAHAPAVGSRWADWQNAMFEQVMDLSTPLQALRHAQSNVPFDHRAPTTLSVMHAMRVIILSNFIHMHGVADKLYDNPKSMPETILWMNGQLVSNIFFWHLHALLFCLNHADKPRKVIELGGGYGGLCRLFMLNDEPRIERYTIIDLPESLFFSETALRDEFGDEVGYWENGDPGTRIVLVPVNRLHEYELSADLIINQGSFQEMEDTWIDFYMKWLDRLDVRFFYSLNYAGSPFHAMYESRTLWGPRPSPKFATRVVNGDVAVVKMQCTGRYFAEMLYEKTPPTLTLADWSVLKGYHLTRQTYLEGLELFRQFPTLEYAKQLLQTVLDANQKDGSFALPKEAWALTHILIDNGAKGLDQIMRHFEDTVKLINR